MSAIYFIRPVGLDGPIKIGWSKAVETRFRQLAIWSPLPLEIIASVDGSCSEERWLHRCFDYARSHAEWFHPVPALLKTIDRLREGVSLNEAIGSMAPPAKRRRRY